MLRFYSLWTLIGLLSLTQAYASAINCKTVLETGTLTKINGIYVHKFQNSDSRTLYLYSKTLKQMQVDMSTVFKAEPSNGSGSHVRINPLKGPVIISSNVGNRPMSSAGSADPLAPPQAPGQMSEVPAGPWEAAAFVNRFASLSPDRTELPTDLYSPTRCAIGACEVVIYGQSVESDLGHLSVDRIDLALTVFRHRMTELGKLKNMKYVVGIENRGPEAGASQKHPHGQIYALDYVPPKIKAELKKQRDHYKQTGRTLIGDMTRAEIADGRRMIYQGTHVVAFVPIAPDMPFEVWIVPLRPSSQPQVAKMDELTPEEQLDMAKALKSVITRYDSLWPGSKMPYNMGIIQGPTDGRSHPEAHLRIELRPEKRAADKYKIRGGVEESIGVENPAGVPEDMAKALRDVQVP